VSLTEQLKNPKSPVSVFMAKHMKEGAVNVLIGQYNAKIAEKRPIITEGVNPDIVGTAFDYAFRWQIEQLVPRETVAWLGARDARDEFAIMDLVTIGNDDPESRAACAVVLSWFERIARSGHVRTELEAAHVGLSSEGPYLDRLLAHVPAADEADVTRLMATVGQVWGSRLRQQPYIGNPMFEGSKDTGGADADWIIGRTLYECKTTRKRQPFTREMFLQVIGYVLLDYTNKYRLENVCWYFARHQLLLDVPLSSLFHDLPSLRTGFKKHLRPPAITHSHTQLDRILGDIAYKHHGDELDFDLFLGGD